MTTVMFDDLTRAQRLAVEDAIQKLITTYLTSLLPGVDSRADDIIDGLEQLARDLKARGLLAPADEARVRELRAMVNRASFGLAPDREDPCSE